MGRLSVQTEQSVRVGVAPTDIQILRLNVWSSHSGPICVNVAPQGAKIQQPVLGSTDIRSRCSIPARLVPRKQFCESTIQTIVGSAKHIGSTAGRGDRGRTMVARTTLVSQAQKVVSSGSNQTAQQCECIPSSTLNLSFSMVKI